MNAPLWEERALREAVLAGDEQAWETLYERSFGRLYTFVYFRTGRDAHRTDEIVQECWMTAVRRIRSFDPERGSFLAWMQGIAENVLRNKRRRWLRLSRTEVPLEGQTGVLVNPKDAVRRLALAEQVGLALSSLPPAHREVLEAKYGEGATVAEIAALRGQTPKAVESLLSRGRAGFREAFSQLADGMLET